MDVALWLSVFAQQAFKNLDSLEKFWIGGSPAVRAYPLNGKDSDGTRDKVRAWVNASIFF